MIFVQKVRDKKAAGMDIKEAVGEAVDECISEGILADFFKKYRKEIVDMSIWEFDQELHDRAMWEDGEADGLVRGESIGLKKGESIGLQKGELRKLISQVCKKVEMKQSLEQIAAELVEEISVIKPIYKIVVELAPDYDADEIYARLQDA